MRLLLIACMALLISGCASVKPWHYAAERQDHEIVVPTLVVYGDFERQEVVDVVQAAVVDFALRTRIIVDVIEYKPIKWQSREFSAMSRQVLTLYPHGIPARWVFLIYRKTVIEWVMLFLVGGNVEGMGEAGGHWAFVNRLSSDLIVHELYHLGWRIQ